MDEPSVDLVDEAADDRLSKKEFVRVWRRLLAEVFTGIYPEHEWNGRAKLVFEQKLRGKSYRSLEFVRNALREYVRENPPPVRAPRFERESS